MEEVKGSILQDQVGHLVDIPKARPEGTIKAKPNFKKRGFKKRPPKQNKKPKETKKMNLQVIGTERQRSKGDRPPRPTARPPRRRAPWRTCREPINAHRRREKQGPYYRRPAR